MLLVVGLGNPGPKYEMTRHNAGFLLVDEIADHFSIPLKNQSKFKGDLGKGLIFGAEALILKPMTYMNLSGQSVSMVLKYYNISVNHLVTVFDDLDLPSGTVKMRQGGGHGGHNGIRDILAKLGSDEFYRIKVGIGRPDKDSRIPVSDWVLNNLSEQELLSYQRGVRDLVFERLEGIVKQLKF